MLSQRKHRWAQPQAPELSGVQQLCAREWAAAEVCPGRSGAEYSRHTLFPVSTKRHLHDEISEVLRRPGPVDEIPLHLWKRQYRSSAGAEVPLAAAGPSRPGSPGFDGGRAPGPLRRLALVLLRLGLRAARLLQAAGAALAQRMLQGAKSLAQVRDWLDVQRTRHRSICCMIKGVLPCQSTDAKADDACWQARGGSLVMGVVFVLGMALVSGIATVPGARYAAVPQEVVYSEFLDLVRAGNVRKARIDESLQKVYFSVQPSAATVAPELAPRPAGLPDASSVPGGAPVILVYALAALGAIGAYALVGLQEPLSVCRLIMQACQHCRQRQHGRRRSGRSAAPAQRPRSRSSSPSAWPTRA